MKMLEISHLTNTVNSRRYVQGLSGLVDLFRWAYLRGEWNNLNDDTIELQEQKVKKDSIVFLTDNTAIGSNTI